MHSEGNAFKISGVCFKITYLMTNQSFLSSFKRNIFLVKIIANSALNKKHFCIVYYSCFGETKFTFKHPMIKKLIKMYWTLRYKVFWAQPVKDPHRRSSVYSNCGWPPRRSAGGSTGECLVLPGTQTWWPQPHPVSVPRDKPREPLPTLRIPITRKNAVIWISSKTCISKHTLG